MRYKYIWLLMFLSIALFGEVGKIEMLKGDVYLLRNNKSVKAYPHLKLMKKDIISTYKNSLVKIVFSDNTIVTLGSKTIFKVEDYLYDGTKKSKTDLKVASGFFRVITGAIGKVAKKRFRLRTKNATIGIRGTVFEGTTGENMDVIRCIRDSITVTSQGETVVVNAGEYTVVSPAQTPLQPTQYKNDKKRGTPSGAKNSNSDNKAAIPLKKTVSVTTLSADTENTQNSDQQSDNTQKILYEEFAKEAKNILKTALSAQESANIAYSRLVASGANINSYTTDAYNAATLAAKAAKEALFNAQKAAMANESATKTKSYAQETEYIKNSVDTIKENASSSIKTVEKNTDIVKENTNTISFESEQLNKGVALENDNGDTLLFEAKVAKDAAVKASASVEEYKNQAVELEEQAASKLQEARVEATKAAVYAAQVASEAANVYFSRILEAQNNISSYETEAYSAAQEAADAAARAAQQAQQESAAKDEYELSQSSADDAKTSADEIHQIGIEVDGIKDQASEQVNIAKDQSDIANTKASELAAGSGDSKTLFEESFNAKDAAVKASASVEEYKNQAVELEEQAASKLQEANAAKESAIEHADKAKEEADKARAARTPAPVDDGGGNDGGGDYCESGCLTAG